MHLLHRVRGATYGFPQPARTRRQQTGDIDVSGTLGGSIRITGEGRIVTSGDLASTGSAGNGGQIDVSAADRTSLLGATLDASGSVDGGEIRVGGEFQGGRDLPASELVNSRQTLISPGTQVLAVGESGRGGTAIFWSDQRTQFYGGADVRGSGADGTGGFVEVSSADVLEYQTIGTVMTGGGTVLLDPKNGVIMDQAPSGLNMIMFSLAGGGSIDAFDSFGTSVDFNSAGTLLAVGAPGDDGGAVLSNGSGAVYLFDVDQGSAAARSCCSRLFGTASTSEVATHWRWKPVPVSGPGSHWYGDGDILAVGASGVQPENPGPLTDDSGAVYLFNLSGTNGSTQVTLGQILEDDSPLAGGGTLDLVDTVDPALQGNSVIIPNDLTERKALFDRLGSDDFGTSVDLNDDGSQLVVGAPGFNLPATSPF